MENQVKKLQIAVHKFSSCDGCQLALINASEKLIELAELAEIIHFAEVGIVNPYQEVDLAIIEGGISTPEEVERIHKIRAISKFLLPIGACATAGGVQALRNFNDAHRWLGEVYMKPEQLEILTTSTAIRQHVKVDLELWGCPVDSQQLYSAIRLLMWGLAPQVPRDSLCLECKRQGTVCVLVAKGLPCMGPVTQTGCGVLCPKLGRECYECFGPKENANCRFLGRRFISLGLKYKEIAQRFLLINNSAPSFQEAGIVFENKSKEYE